MVLQVDSPANLAGSDSITLHTKDYRIGILFEQRVPTEFAVSLLTQNIHLTAPPGPKPAEPGMANDCRAN